MDKKHNGHHLLLIRLKVHLEIEDLLIQNQIILIRNDDGIHGAMKELMKRQKC